MKQKKFYGVVSSSVKTTKVEYKKDKLGRIVAEQVGTKRPVDLLVTSDFTNRLDAIGDIKSQASKLGGQLKFIGAFN